MISRQASCITKVSLCTTARLYSCQVRLRAILVDSGMGHKRLNWEQVLTPFDFLIVKIPCLGVKKSPLLFVFTPFEIYLFREIVDSQFVDWESACAFEQLKCMIY